MNLTNKKTLTANVGITRSVFDANDSQYIAQVVYERVIADMDEADSEVAEDFYALAEPSLEQEFLVALVRSVNTLDKLANTIGDYRVDIQRTSVYGASAEHKRPHEAFTILMYRL